MNRRLDEILVSAASIGVLIALRHFLTPNLTISIIMASLGAILLLWGNRILDGEPSQVKSFFISLVGVLLVIGGLQFIAEHFAVEYWWIAGIAGIVLYSTHHWISERF